MGDIDIRIEGMEDLLRVECVFERRQYEVTPMNTLNECRLVCDVVAVKRALDAGRADMSDVPLHSAYGPPRFDLVSEQSWQELRSMGLPDLLEQLHCCAMQSAGRAGLLLLHAAAMGSAAVPYRTLLLELVLALGPATARARTAHEGWTPLHYAAVHSPHKDAVALLLAAAPAAAQMRGSFGLTPLEAHLAYTTRSETARPLLAAGPALDVLRAIRAAGRRREPLFADFVRARPRLSELEWAVVPAPCPGLGRALPAALAHSPEQARQVVARLPAEDASRLRMAALCLARAQRQAGTLLPLPLAWQILSRFDCCA